MSFSHLFRAFIVAPCFLVLMLWVGGSTSFAVDDVVLLQITRSTFPSAREAIQEAIETEGLVVSAIVPFNKMLSRTADELGHQASPYGKAEIIQFCSSALAWQMILEASEQLALCPLSIAIYSRVESPETVFLAYRSPGRSTPGRANADDLLRRLVRRAAELARLAW